ncbi:hypothetical protein BDY17DRAFT_70217 [Neohortaea acidophila]|uniref:Uncharacterized protein n=1 Tax=Neohortaea acidophila TaxID=245834 RepID=A0A6A6Q317_9PEZI|nr:uncharacterized protein BDY17DRAFT_70217 [Neohortaea acidophila]KAF2486053.1 hypothetical protein BDY17DRAFT_70217 [Neohortaea acidophila]
MEEGEKGVERWGKCKTGWGCKMGEACSGSGAQNVAPAEASRRSAACPRYANHPATAAHAWPAFRHSRHFVLFFLPGHHSMLHSHPTSALPSIPHTRPCIDELRAAARLAFIGGRMTPILSQDRRRRAGSESRNPARCGGLHVVHESEGCLFSTAPSLVDTCPAVIHVP